MRPYKVVTSSQDLGGIAREIYSASEVALDFETASPKGGATFDPFTGLPRLLSLNTGGDRIYVVDLYQTGTLGPVRDALAATNAVIVAQNAKYDQKWALWHYGLEFGRLFDPFRASSLLHAGIRNLGHNLWDLYERELQQKPETQDLGGSDWNAPLSPEQLDYAAEDVIHLPRLREVLKKKIVDAGLARIAQIEFQAVLPEAAIELNGLHLNAAKWLARAGADAARKDALSKELLEALPSPHDQLALPGLRASGRNTFNIDSTDQLLQSLRRFGVRRLEDTTEETLAMLEESYPILAKVIEYRGYAMAVKTFGPEYLDYVDRTTGRIHTSFFPYTAAGRYASRDPNLTQIPRGKEYRECFDAEDGRELTLGDFSNIEMRVVAEVSGDPVLKRVFAEGRDAHYATAALMSGIPEAELRKTKEGKALRQQAKPVNFGFCVAEGQRVLTRKAGQEPAPALVPIESVNLDHLVWDGVEWVSHEGVVFMGERDTRRYQGLTATGDHEVYTATGEAVSLDEAAERGFLLACGGVGNSPIPFSPALPEGGGSGWARHDDTQKAGKFRVYDLLNAGPRHRFTVEGKIVSNCFGMGANTLVPYARMGYGVNLSRSQAKALRHKFFDAYKGLAAWHELAVTSGKRLKSTRTIMGRRRIILEDTRNEFMNSPIQGCIPGDQRVLTSAGYLPIGSLLGREDGKLAWTGTRLAPFRVLDRGEDERVEVRLDNGKRFSCDTRHKVYVPGADGYEERLLSELQIGAPIAVNRAQAIEYGGGLRDEDAYWLGYYAANGHVTDEPLLVPDRSRHDNCHRSLVFTIGEREHLRREDQVKRCRAYLVSLGLVPRKDMVKNGCTSVSVGGKAAVAVWTGLGALANETAHTKRVPRSVWAAGLSARKMFLRGFLDGDFCLDDKSRKAQVSANLCNESLCEDLWLLGHTTGIDGRLYGPYRADSKGHLSWRLTWYRGMVYDALGVGGKSKINRAGPLAQPFECRRLLATHRGFDFNGHPRASSLVLKSRVRCGGLVGVHQLARMGCPPDYSTARIVGVRRTGIRERMYTLSVDDLTHRYVAEGVVSKNSAADGQKNALRLIYEKLRPLNGGAPPLLGKGANVGQVHMVHDENILEHRKDPDLQVAVQKALHDGMMEGMAPSLPTVPCVVECGSGPDWSAK